MLRLCCFYVNIVLDISDGSLYKFKKKKQIIFQIQRIDIDMKTPQQLECIDQEELDRTRQQIKQILNSLTKNELTSIKGMILPPMFTFNVLKLIKMIKNPKMSHEEITWQVIKKDMLPSIDIFKRKCQVIRLTDFQDHEIQSIEQHFQQTFKSIGNNIQTKSQLYGSFVQKICKFCLRARTILYGSKFLRSED